jgi:hypothetical protein
MARIWSSGFELNSTTAGVEFTSTSVTLPSIVTSLVRSGTYALRANPTTSHQFVKYSFALSGSEPSVVYIREYIRVASAPSTQTLVLSATHHTTDQLKFSIRMNTDRTLELWDEENGVQVGSDSTALDADTWYRLELKVDSTTPTSPDIEARINGSSFASGSVSVYGDKPGNIRIGISTWNATADIYFDDIAVNDSSGSYQNSWPGEGKIIHLRPSVTGDNGDWTGDNTDIDEVTPDNDTTKIASNTTNHIEDVNIDNTPSGLLSSDSISLIHVGVRYNGVGSSANSSFVVRAKKASAGTVSEGSAITPANTTWMTNANAAPKNYPLTLYQDPDSNNWTKANLDTTQIGVRISTGNTNDAQVSTLWLLVEYIPAPSVNDDITLTENTTLLLQGYIDTLESITVSEDSTVEVNAPVTPTINNYDTLTLTEDVSVEVGEVPALNTNVYDAITITDNVVVAQSADVLKINIAGYTGVRIF